jgi:hypothetical protein
MSLGKWTELDEIHAGCITHDLEDFIDLIDFWDFCLETFLDNKSFLFFWFDKFTPVWVLHDYIAYWVLVSISS